MEKLNKPTYDIDILAYKGKALRIVARKRLNPTVPNDGHIILRNKAIEHANIYAAEIPLEILISCNEIIKNMLDISNHGNPNSISDIPKKLSETGLKINIKPKPSKKHAYNNILGENWKFISWG